MIILTGEPKSTQHCYKYTCRGAFASMYMDKKCKDLKEEWMWEAKSQWMDIPLMRPIKLSITYYFGTKRKCDLDNFNKLTLDALTGVVYEDDSQIDELNIKRGYDKKNPRVEVFVEPHDAPA